MTNEQIINALTVLRDVLKSAKLSYHQADQMIKELKENPVVIETEVERAFCAGFVCNLQSMDDFKEDRLKNKFEVYKQSRYLNPINHEPN